MVSARKTGNRLTVHNGGSNAVTNVQTVPGEVIALRLRPGESVGVQGSPNLHYARVKYFDSLGQLCEVDVEDR